MSARRRRRRLLQRPGEGDDPLASLTNLFDVALVFSVALMAALVGRFNLSDLLVAENFTWVKNPGTPEMEIVTKRGDTITQYKPQAASDATGPRGRRVGAAYQLESGEIVYVPDE